MKFLLFILLQIMIPDGTYFYISDKTAIKQLVAISIQYNNYIQKTRLQLAQKDTIIAVLRRRLKKRKFNVLNTDSLFYKHKTLK